MTKLINDDVDTTEENVSDMSENSLDVSVVSIDEIMEIIKGPDFPT